MSDLTSYFAMGGYGGYVWPAYGLTFSAFALLLVWTLATLRARRRTERELAALARPRRVRRDAKP